MIRRLARIVPALALGLGVASASAQTSTVVLFGNLGGSRPVATTEIPAQLTGELLISFHGDPATGCAGQGLCAYSGTVLVRPGPGSGIEVAAYRTQRHRTYQAALSVGGAPGTDQTTAQVNRAGGGTCADVEQPFVTLPATIAHGTITLPLLQPGGILLGTRCTGPLDGDFTGLSPQITISLRDLLRGRTTLDLSGTRSFAAAGFAGTVDSTLRLILGRPASQNQFPHGTKTTLMRQVDETLTITRASGQSSLALNGDPSSCQFLDSCALSGMVDATYDPTGASGALTVLGPASRPYRDFLAALGLSRRGNPHGLQILGTIGWTGGGTVTSNLEQGGRCTSQAPLAGGAIDLQERGDRLGAQYTTAEPSRTRCPGPDLPEGTALAQGVIPLRELAGRSFTLPLSGDSQLTDDGYSVDQRTALSLSVRRGALRETTLRVPG